MRIENTGRGTYLVTSHGQTFNVDVLAHKGAGQCDCFHWLTRIKPLHELPAEERRNHPPAQLKCPHIVACDAEELMVWKNFLIKKYRENEQPT